VPWYCNQFRPYLLRSRSPLLFLIPRYTFSSLRRLIVRYSAQPKRNSVYSLAVRPSVRASKSLRSSVTHHPLVFTVLFIEIVRKQQRLTVHDDTRGATKRITTDVNNILYPAVPRLSQRAIVVKVDDEVCAAAADFRYTRPTCIFAVWRGSSR